MQSKGQSYYSILSKCNEVITLSTRYYQGCYHAQNRYMVDHSSKMICAYDVDKGRTVYIIKYAEQNNLQIVNLYKN